ncbi:hypothetical protein PTKIN_Ptkin04bG0205000 [Pterospermum kingtungense]
MVNLLCIPSPNAKLEKDGSCGRHHLRYTMPIRCVEDLLRFSYGFGYDPISDDYKLVRMVLFKEFDGDDMLETTVGVYSLRTNSWRRIKYFPFRLKYLYSMLCIGWFVKSPVLMPRPLLLVSILGLRNTVWCHFRMVWVDVHDIWIMEEYGVKESWAKLISLKHPCNLCEELVWKNLTVFPLAYSKSGHKLLLEEGAPESFFRALSLLMVMVRKRHWSAIPKLTDAKSAVLQQNQILNQELEISKSQAGGFSFLLLVGLLGVLIDSYLVKRD